MRGLGLGHIQSQGNCRALQGQVAQVRLEGLRGTWMQRCEVEFQSHEGPEMSPACVRISGFRVKTWKLTVADFTPLPSRADISGMVPTPQRRVLRKIEHVGSFRIVPGCMSSCHHLHALRHLACPAS